MLLMTYPLQEETCLFLVCQGSIQFFVKKAEKYIKKEKRKSRDLSQSLAL
jgi:hypothetical protein